MCIVQNGCQVLENQEMVQVTRKRIDIRQVYEDYQGIEDRQLTVAIGGGLVLAVHSECIILRPDEMANDGGDGQEKRAMRNHKENRRRLRENVRECFSKHRLEGSKLLEI